MPVPMSGGARSLVIAVVAVLVAFAAPFALSGAIGRDEVPRPLAEPALAFDGSAEPFAPTPRTLRVHGLGPAVPVPRLKPIRRRAQALTRRRAAAAARGPASSSIPTPAAVPSTAPLRDSVSRRPAPVSSAPPSSAPRSTPPGPAPAPAPKPSPQRPDRGETFDSRESFDTTG